MTWRDDLRPASFRGVPFFVESVTTTHELWQDEQHFPGRERSGDAVHVEPLGAGPEKFSVTAFVVGPDYNRGRDALVAALTQPGEGRLVHPYRGERTVAIIGTIQVVEQRQRGGYAQVTFQAVETSTPRLRRSPDTAAVVAADLDAFIGALADDFDSTFDADGPELLTRSSTSIFDDAVGLLSTGYNEILSRVGQASDYASAIGGYVDDLAGFATSAFTAAKAIIGALARIAGTPQRLGVTALSSTTGARSVAGAVLAALAPLIAIGDDLAPIPATTTTRQREAANRAATVQMIRGAALAAVARSIVTLPFASRSDALSIRDELADAFDRLIQESSAGGDTAMGAALYETLAAARASTSAHLTRIARTLPEIESYVVPAPLPALVIAHRLFGDARQAEALIARNDPPDPARIAAGTELEVLRG